MWSIQSGLLVYPLGRFRRSTIKKRVVRITCPLQKFQQRRDAFRNGSVKARGRVNRTRHNETRPGNTKKGLEHLLRQSTTSTAALNTTYVLHLKKIHWKRKKSFTLSCYSQGRERNGVSGSHSGCCTWIGEVGGGYRESGGCGGGSGSHRSQKRGLEMNMQILAGIRQKQQPARQCRAAAAAAACTCIFYTGVCVHAHPHGLGRFVWATNQLWVVDLDQSGSESRQSSDFIR